VVGLAVGAPSISTSDVMTTTAALPLSNMSEIVDVSFAVPDGGIGRCSVTACWPCTSSAGLNVPMPRMALPWPQASTTGIVGNTRCVTPFVFSVVNSSSSTPAPMLTA
jgi:hypothetical protein